VWLNDDERRGFIEGFANEGLWPMCHRCEVAPEFLASDWWHYRRVNERFADAVLKAAKDPEPLVLVQDYHFALLPHLIRARLPQASVVAFWHIPWPSLDRLKACPWWPSLMQGLLSSSIVGFQTARDQKHFVAAASVYKSRCKQGSASLGANAAPVVAAYPISVPWPTNHEVDALPSVSNCREQVLKKYSLPSHVRLIVGIDRFDYTKGLLEKVLAMESLLDRHPQLHGSVSLVQVAAPTRADVPAYAAYRKVVRAEVERINSRLRCNGVAPVVLLEFQHDRAAVCRLYRAASVCAVASLDDGMNLVSKEFVSMRDDEQGVLVLSAFAGAAEELAQDAILVDPRDTFALADSLAAALSMSDPEQRFRMARMRLIVRRANIHRWAASMLNDAARLREEQAGDAVAWPAVA